MRYDITLLIPLSVDVEGSVSVVPRRRVTLLSNIPDRGSSAPGMGGPQMKVLQRAFLSAKAWAYRNGYDAALALGGVGAGAAGSLARSVSPSSRLAQLSPPCQPCASHLPAG